MWRQWKTHEATRRRPLQRWEKISPREVLHSTSNIPDSCMTDKLCAYSLQPTFLWITLNSGTLFFFLFYSRRLSNGYIIKIGRGLNYFLPVDKFCLGYSNYDFRKCKETNVDIFFCPENKKVWKNNHQKPFWHVISVSHWTKLKKKTILYSSTLFILFWIKTIQNPMPWAALKIRH